MREIDRQILQKKLETLEWSDFYIEDDKLIIELKNHVYSTALGDVWEDCLKHIRKSIKFNDELPRKINMDCMSEEIRLELIEILQNKKC